MHGYSFHGLQCIIIFVDGFGSNDDTLVDGFGSNDDTVMADPLDEMSDESDESDESKGIRAYIVTAAM